MTGAVKPRSWPIIASPGTAAPDSSPHDLAFGAHCCAPCHDKIDGRVMSHMTREDLRLAHAEGVMRTIAALVRDGVVKC